MNILLYINTLIIIFHSLYLLLISVFLYLQSLYFTIVHSRNELVIISIIGIRQMLSLNIHHKNYLLYCNNFFIIITNYHYIFNTHCIYYCLHVLTEFNNCCISTVASKSSSKLNYPVSGWGHTPH